MGDEPRGQGALCAHRLPSIEGRGWGGGEGEGEGMGRGGEGEGQGRGVERRG